MGKKYLLKLVSISAIGWKKFKNGGKFLKGKYEGFISCCFFSDSLQI